MYEQMEYRYILSRMLERVPDIMDKREGSVIYDALAPAAAELANMYIELDSVLNQTFADTATGRYLDMRCAERGIVRQAATFATVRATVSPVNIDITGQRFSCGQFNYKALSGAEGEYQMQCETSGTGPNGTSGIMIPIEYIPGLESAKITEMLVPGENAEADESLRRRFYASIESQAYGGNIKDYKDKTNAIDGVGGVKVTPVWNGGGTVKLTIIASDYTVPTKTLIDTVQKQIDDIVPIGHVVTVEGVTAEVVSISTKITYQQGWNWETVKKYAEKTLRDYLVALAESWAESDGLVVRISQFEARMLDCTGVIDITGTKINGSAANMAVSSHAIPVFGGITDES